MTALSDIVEKKRGGRVRERLRWKLRRQGALGRGKAKKRELFEKTRTVRVVRANEVQTELTLLMRSQTRQGNGIGGMSAHRCLGCFRDGRTC